MRTWEIVVKQNEQMPETTDPPWLLKRNERLKNLAWLASQNTPCCVNIK